jgi:hypothetical protein
MDITTTDPVVVVVHDVCGVHKELLETCIAFVKNRQDIDGLKTSHGPKYMFTDRAMTTASFANYVRREFDLGERVEVCVLLLVTRASRQKFVQLPQDYPMLALVPPDPYGEAYNSDGADGITHDRQYHREDENGDNDEDDENGDQDEDGGEDGD